MLVRQALAAGLHVGIATLSTQPQLIHQMLRMSIPAAKDVPVRGGSGAVICEDRSVAVVSEASKAAVGYGGKQMHIASLIDTIAERHSVSISASEVCLIDDDATNIMIAGQCNMVGLWLDPKDPDAMYRILSINSH